jgi:long-chain acyl-CoA synthetase
VSGSIGALAAALHAALDARADADVLLAADEAWTARRVLDRADAIAQALCGAGLAPHEPVPVFVSNAPEDVAAFLGVWLARGVVVPMHRSATPASVRGLLDATGARLVVGDAPSAPEGAGRQGPLLSLGGAAPAPRALLEGAAFVIFTSGSTGVPKGAVLAHDAFAAKLDAIDTRLSFGAGERALLVLNVTFVFGIWFALLALTRGGTLVMRPRFDAGGFLRLLADESIDRVAVVPTMMRALFAAQDDAAIRRACAELAARGLPCEISIGGEILGASLAARIHDALPGTRLVDIYGLTETNACDFYLMPADQARFAGCIGRPGPGEAYRIVAPDGAPVAGGDIGELEIMTPYLMRGYLDAPELTREALRGGWFRTGDLAREREPGVVELAGRRKELIYRGGNKIAPLEVEHALTLHPDVAAALAVGMPDAVLGERIHVLLVPRPGAVLMRDDVLRAAAVRLERHRLPDVLYVAADLPQGRTGKADRGALRELIAARQVTPLA